MQRFATPFLNKLSRELLNSMGSQGGMEALIEKLKGTHTLSHKGDQYFTLLDVVDSTTRKKIEPTLTRVTNAWREEHKNRRDQGGFVDFTRPESFPAIQSLGDVCDDMYCRALEESLGRREVEKRS